MVFLPEPVAGTLATSDATVTFGCWCPAGTTQRLLRVICYARLASPQAARRHIWLKECNPGNEAVLF